MGYDFTTRESSPTADTRGYNPEDSFHLNVWGMGRYRDLMVRAGMMSYTDQTDPFPTDAFSEDEDGEEVISEAGQLYLTAKNPADATGLAFHKFCSNDPWITTPEEITEALDVWDQLSVNEQGDLLAGHGFDGNNIEHWQKWLAYLRRAIGLGGFTTG